MSLGNEDVTQMYWMILWVLNLDAKHCCRELVQVTGCCLVGTLKLRAVHISTLLILALSSVQSGTVCSFSSVSAIRVHSLSRAQCM